MSKQRLTQFFGTTYWIMDKQTEGLTHADSVLQPSIRGNCMNWVLGHILESREKILMALEQETLMTNEERERYQRGSAPVTDAEDCVNFERLLSMLHDSQARINTALDALTDDDLNQPMDPEAEKPQTLDERLTFMLWHETYHTGQFEHLRQLAGTDDVVIP